MKNVPHVSQDQRAAVVRQTVNLKSFINCDLYGGFTELEVTPFAQIKAFARKRGGDVFQSD